MPVPPPPPGYEKCITAALEQVIATAEGTNTAPNGGYGLLVYGLVVSAPASFGGLVGLRGSPSHPITIENPEGLSGNPGIVVKTSAGLSTAFGRYQINQPTATEFNVTDWSPAGQDAAAAAIMNSRDMVSAAMQGGFAGFQQAMWNGNTRWASLPDSPYGQPTMTMPGAYGVYESALATLLECQ
jgi:hypothetical protein